MIPHPASRIPYPASRWALLLLCTFSPLLPCSSSAATGAWLYGTNVFANAQGSGRVNITFTPQSNHVVLPNGALMRTYPVTILTSNTSGSIGSNFFVAGPYRVSTPETIDTFNIIVPADDAAYDWVTLSGGSFNFVTTMAGVVRGVAPGTNVTTSTNAGVVTVNSSGSGSGGSATNAVADVYSNNVAVATGATSIESTNPGQHIDIRWAGTATPRLRTASIRA
jgi:hypothetical protein